MFDQEKQQILEIEKCSSIEEQALRHKARANWSECGDSNSKYFHAQWKIRASQNAINSIYTEAGVKLTDPVQVEQEFISVFSGIMGDCASELPCLNSMRVRSGTCLTVLQQRELIKEITDEEILEAIRAMPVDKAPGVGSFTIEFFTKNWEIVKTDVLVVEKQFSQTGILFPNINSTAITLIPKISSPTKVKDYRPIACCTTLYKIISKVITRRLKTVIANLIGCSQSAFVKGRSIIDNVLFSLEIFKGYTRKLISPRCVLKVDLRKAS